MRGDESVAMSWIGDEIRRPLLELLLQRLRRIADHEHLVLLVADAPADLAAFGGEVLVAVAQDLRRDVRQFTRGLPFLLGNPGVVDRGVPLGHFMYRLWHDCFRMAEDNARLCVKV